MSHAGTKSITPGVSPVIKALECPICFYIVPLGVLQCGHFCCPGCIAKIYEENRRISLETKAGKKAKLICPFCAKESVWGNRKTNYYEDSASKMLTKYFKGTTLCEEDGHGYMSHDIHCYTCDKDVCGVCYTDMHRDHNCVQITLARDTKHASNEENGDLPSNDDIVFYDAGTELAPDEENKSARICKRSMAYHSSGGIVATSSMGTVLLIWL